MNKPTEIPIFFTVDDRYAPFLSVALCSAVRNADPAKRYRAIILYQELSADNRTRLGALKTDWFQVDFVPMRAGLEGITDRMSNRLRCDYFTLTIYFRLFIPAMFPEYDRGLYIDSDVVVESDLAELFHMDIGDNYIGACHDYSVDSVPELRQYFRGSIGVEPNLYINSGMLLMNLKRLREVDLDRRFLTLLTTYHVECLAPDQDYLNAMCNGHIYYLDECWNAMPNERREPLKTVKIVHYNLFSKPWCYDGITYEDRFWHYASDSGYFSEIRTFKESYSEEQKQSDRRCMQMLINRGPEIAASEVTFRKLREKGVDIRL